VVSPEDRTQVMLEADQDWEGGRKAGEGNVFVIGESVLREANDTYGAIVEMPAPKARRRGRKAAEEAAEAPESAGEPELEPADA
jgi:hypothetical protein